MLMAVSQFAGSDQPLKRSAAAKVLESVYRSFSFVDRAEHPDVRIVKAFVKVPAQHGFRLYGGSVEQRDFVTSIDPIRFRVRRALQVNSIKIGDLVLEEFHPRRASLDFIFLPKKQKAAVGASSRT